MRLEEPSLHVCECWRQLRHSDGVATQFVLDYARCRTLPMTTLGSVRLPALQMGRAPALS